MQLCLESPVDKKLKGSLGMELRAPGEGTGVVHLGKVYLHSCSYLQPYSDKV